MRSKIDKDRLAELWHRGMPVPHIAGIMGIKADSVYKCAHRMGLPKRKGGKIPLLSDPEKKKWFIRNYPEMSNGTIGVYLGISEEYIGKLARRLGLKKSESYWEGIKDYHRKRVNEYHGKHKGDKEYYGFNERPRLNGKFIKSNDNENLHKPSNLQ